MRSFPRDIALAAFDRQRGRCGYCGKDIYENSRQYHMNGAWNAHHANGKNDDHRQANCICLCINRPERCHWHAHEGKWHGEWTWANSWFRFARL
jgi:hypothetical protein